MVILLLLVGQYYGRSQLPLKYTGIMGNLGNKPKIQFDVIVVGGGHAGIEAAYASARMGSKTALITLDLDKIGLMPCNPSVGGVGKGHIVYEVSAMGGLMPQLCTQTYVQARMLNTRKGPAVQGLRLQIDKYAYNKLSKKMLEKTDNLTLVAGMVDEVLLDSNNTVTGIKTNSNEIYHTRTVVLTTGTFLNGKIHIGEKNHAAGRRGEQAVTTLSAFLKKIGLRMGRLKTGTPPRLARESVDFSKLEYQEPDSLNYLFEFYPHEVKNTHACYIAHTNEKTHTIIKDNLHKSAMYSGNMSGKGPRYCPSIEDKIARFPDKQSHHIFVEPEGVGVDEVYPSGISTSLPLDVQQEYINSIVGFENAIITKPGYAIEYDFVLPDQLTETLEVKTVDGLYLAGQINGTTGYEEAAGQGIVVGINASLKCKRQEPFILDRGESYIGVMINDLVNLSVDEPYRMFTSRAERRLRLRQDNVFLRLTDKAYNLGLIDEQMHQDFTKEKIIIKETLERIRSKFSNSQALKTFGDITCNEQKLRDYIGKQVSGRAIAVIHAEIRYEPYLLREEQEIKKNKQYQSLVLPKDLLYSDIQGLSKELQEKLNRYKPANIAQAALIPGITPAALSLLIFKTRMRSKENKQ